MVRTRRWYSAWILSRTERTDWSLDTSALEHAAARPGSSANNMTSCENWIAIRSWAPCATSTFSGTARNRSR